MSFPFYDQVERSYNELKAAGQIRPSSNQEEVENQKGLMTRRAAYYTSLIQASYGILEKTSGNNSMGYSTDIIINNDGTYYDIATDVEVGAGQREARPVNGGPSFDTALIPRWRQATKALAGLEGPIPEPEPEPEPPDNDDEIIDLLQQILTVQQLTLSVLQEQQKTLEAHTVMLDKIQTTLDNMGVGGKFPITYPDYKGRIVGFNVTLVPDPRTNP